MARMLPDPQQPEASDVANPIADSESVRFGCDRPGSSWVSGSRRVAMQPFRGLCMSEPGRGPAHDITRGPDRRGEG